MMMILLTRVMVFAVNRELSDLKLQVFSNFLNDDLSHGTSDLICTLNLFNFSITQSKFYKLLNVQFPILSFLVNVVITLMLLY